MKELKLADGRLIQVSDVDFEYFNKNEWRMTKLDSYVRKSELMHRIVANRKQEEDCNDSKVIHIDSNMLNNQRDNIKVKK